MERSGGGGSGRNILGNVLCRVLSFLRDFPPRFFYIFFRYPLDAICSAHRYIRYVHIHIRISICICKPEAAVKWEVFLYSAWQNVFMHFLNGN